ncbi:MAG: hypothetical protein AB7O45_00550 [Alphaproteobacteria bacterium]
MRAPTAGDVSEMLADPDLRAGLGLIFEVEPYSTAAAATTWLRWSDFDLTTGPAETPANTRMEARLHAFRFREALWGGDGVFGGSRVNTGSAELDNTDGGLLGLIGVDDDGMRAYHWRRRRWRALVGHETWDYADFRPFASGLIDDISGDDDVITIGLRDRLVALDRPVQEDVFAGDRVLLNSASSVAVGTGSKSFTIPDLVANGTFTSDLASWTAGSGWAHGSAAAQKTAGAATALTQALTTAAGNRYYCRFTAARSAGTLQFQVNGANVGDPISAGATVEREWTADGSTSTIGFLADAAFAGSVDDVTARQDGTPAVGDVVRIAQTSALATNYMIGTVASWSRTTGALGVTVASVGGSGTISDWSIWLRPYNGTAENAGKARPLAWGSNRFVEPEPLGVVQGLYLFMVTDGPSTLSAGYDGADALTPAGSFPPGAGEYWHDEDVGATWVATRPAFVFTCDVGGGGGDLTTRRIFAAEGSTTFVVPTGVTTIHVKAWGAGGGGGDPADGGGGAFVEGDITVTPGESLTVVVGGGGKVSVTLNARATGGTSAIAPGGRSGFIPSSGVGSAGGGASGVLRGSTRLIVAGAGGGAAQDRPGGFGGDDSAAGDGNLGSADSIDGLGADDTSGGAGGDATDSALVGEDGDSLGGGDGGPSLDGLGHPAAGGGGGGKFGGGGGAVKPPPSGDAGAGAGATSLIPGGGSAEAGDADTPGGDDDADYAAPAGVGGDGAGATAAAKAGNPGRVVISWSVTVGSTSDAGAADLIEAVLRDRFAERAVRVTEATLTSVAASGNTLTFGGGDVSAIVQPGDVFSFSGLSEASLNGVNRHAVEVTTSTIVCRENLATMSADTDFELRVGSLDFVALDAVAAANDAGLGRYMRDDVPTGRAFVDEILATVGGWMATDADGLLTFGVLSLPGEAAAADFEARHMTQAPRLEPAGPSLWRRRIGAERCWRVHDTSEIADDATDDDEQFVRQEWREGIATDDGVRVKDLSADDAFIAGLFAAKTHADTEAARQLPMFSPDRQGWSLAFDAVALMTPLGSERAFTSADVSISDLRNTVVIGREIDFGEDDDIRLTVWS